MSKVQALALQTSLVTVYDQTKTTFQGGRVGQRTITDGNGAKLVIGPSPVIASSVFDDTGSVGSGVHASTQNGRVFVPKAFAAGLLTVSYYQITTTAGVTTQTWVGDLKFQFTATGTYTLKGFTVDDSSSSSMSFHFGVTNTTTQQGGWYAAWGINATAFVKVSVPTIPIATSGSQSSALYQVGDTTVQGTHTITVLDGIGLSIANKFAYILSGAAATPKLFKLDYTNPPTAAPVGGYSQANGTIVVTAVLPALSGTILLTNNVQVYTPVAQPAPNTGNNGSECVGFLTTSSIYWAKTSDVTNGAATLPSLISVNLVGATADYITPAAVLGQYSQTLDKWIIEFTGSRFIIKQGLNNDPNQKFFGFADALKNEAGSTITPVDFGGQTPLCLTESSGWAVLSNTATGQRNLLLIDLASDESSVNPSTGEKISSIISPVISGNFSQGLITSTYYELAKRSVRPTVQYRTSNFSTGPGTGFDATWTTAPKDGDLSGIVNATQVQFRFLFTIIGMEVTNPPQIIEAYFLYTDLTQNSDKWVGSVDNTTANATTPTRTAFRLISAYTTSVPALTFRAVDDSGNVLVSASTVTNAANFEYTTNNGTSWNALGTIPNTALTTELRYNWTSPPGVAVTCSLRES